MTDADDLRKVVDAARGGDRAAFNELYLRFFRMVRGVLLTRVHNPSDVDDLAQDVFLQAWRQMHSLRDSMAFGGWLRQIAVRQSADHRRRSRPTEELDPSAPAATRPDEEARYLFDEVRRLPEAYQETMILRFAEGMTGPEIAEQTGLTPDSVRVNLHRGVTMLRERLKGGSR